MSDDAVGRFNSGFAEPPRRARRGSGDDVIAPEAFALTSVAGISRLESEVERLAGELARAHGDIQLGLAREVKLREGLRPFADAAGGLSRTTFAEAALYVAGQRLPSVKAGDLRRAAALFAGPGPVLPRDGDFDAVLSEYLAWSLRQFPNGTPASVAAHLRKEVEELCREPESAEELVDIVALAFQSAARQGHDLTATLAAKLPLLKARQWGAPGPDGDVEHVRAEPAPEKREWPEIEAELVEEARESGRIDETDLCRVVGSAAPETPEAGGEEPSKTWPGLPFAALAEREGQLALAHRQVSTALEDARRAHATAQNWKSLADEEHRIAEALRERAEKERDAEMERVKACEHIAENLEGWSVLRNLCPSTAAVASLRDQLVEREAALAALARVAPSLPGLCPDHEKRVGVVVAVEELLSAPALRRAVELDRARREMVEAAVAYIAARRAKAVPFAAWDRLLTAERALQAEDAGRELAP